jgi:hypothetical protein
VDPAGLISKVVIRVKVTLLLTFHPSVQVDVRRSRWQDSLELSPDTMPFDALSARLDVTDFATPVNLVNAFVSKRHRRHLFT